MINLEGLEKLGFDSISLRVTDTKGELDYIDTDINSWINMQESEEKYVNNIDIEIFATNLDTGKKLSIGKITGNLFEPETMMDDISFYHLCDAISVDLEHMASDIIDENFWVKNEICECYECLMYIDRIYIKERFRGLGIASFVIDSLNDILEYSLNLSPDVLVILPTPQKQGEDGLLQEIEDEKTNKQYKKKLYKLYEKLGFKKLKNSNYMIKKTY